MVPPHDPYIVTGFHDNGPYLQVREDTTEARGRATYLLRREIGLRAARDLSGGPPMWVVWPEAIADQGRGHLGNEGGERIHHRGPAILRSMRLLPHMDPSLHAHSRTTLRPAKEKQEIRMDKGTYRGGPEVKTNVYRGTSFTQSGIRIGNSGLHHSRH